MFVDFTVRDPSAGDDLSILCTDRIDDYELERFEIVVFADHINSMAARFCLRKHDDCIELWSGSNVSRFTQYPYFQSATVFGSKRPTLVCKGRLPSRKRSYVPIMSLCLGGGFITCQPDRHVAEFKCTLQESPMSVVIGSKVPPMAT